MLYQLSNIKRLLAIFLIFLSQSFVYSQTAVDVDEKFVSVDLNDYVSVFYTEDTTYKSRLLFNEDTVSFERVRDLTFPRRDGFYWIRFQAHNDTQEDQELILELGSLGPHFTQLYSVVDYDIDTSRMLGAFIPFSERYYDYRKICYPITVPSGENISCYLYIQKSGETLNIPLKLWNQQHFISALSTGEIHIGIMLWACIFMMIVALYFVITAPNRMTICFGLLTLTMLLNLLIQTGLFAKYFAPEYPQLAHDLRIVRRMLDHVLTWVLMMEIFEIRKGQSLFTPMKVMIYIFVVGGFIAALEPFFPIVKTLFGVYIISIAISSIGVLLIPLYYYKKNKDVISSLFVLNALSLLYLIYLAIRGYVLDAKIDSLWFDDVVVYYSFVTCLIFLLAFFYYQWNRASLSRKLQADLANAQNEALHNLLEGQKTERRRLSQQLHDGIGVLLASIRMRLSTIDKTGVLEPIINDLGIVSDDVRNFSHDLSPVILETFGLKAALEDISQKMSGVDVSIRISMDGFENDVIGLKKGTTENIYLILSELISNSLKHGKAKSIIIQMDTKEEGIRVAYQDNGKGFNPNQTKRGIGITSIESRVNLMKGKCNFLVNEDGGLSFKMSIPYNGNA